ncbi:MAG: extracellular solute-binding protein [Sedimenticola sp.]
MKSYKFCTGVFLSATMRNALSVFFAVLLLFHPLSIMAKEQKTPLIIVTSFPQSSFSRFKAAFEQQHPEIEVLIRSKKTSAAISFIEERQSEPVDLVWVSAPDAFEVLKKSEQLLKVFPTSSDGPLRVGGYPLDDPDGFYRGFAISGYGILWNTDYLKRYGLPEPKGWSDLTRPEYAGHIAITAPSRSGTTHLIVETLLQGKGWQDGWATLLELSGNLATITARSFGVLDGVVTGRFGVGATIDFFGLSAKATGAPVEFIYPEITTFLPASIGIVKRVENLQSARLFADFLLSEQGQRLLFEPEISRLPVSKAAYRQAPVGYPSPFTDTLAGRGITFDTALSHQRYHMVNALFDIVITYRLQSLRRSWAAIREAEILLARHQRVDLAAKLEHAGSLLKQVPLSLADSTDDVLAARFVRHKPGIALPASQIEMEMQWNNVVQANQSEALRLVDEVVESLRQAGLSVQ